MYRATDSFLGVNQASLDELIPPKQEEKNGGGCHPYGKYSHNMDHVPISNKKLFLRPLITNFLSATVSIFLLNAGCPFQKMSTNILWRSKRSGLAALILRGTGSSIHIYF